MSRHHGRHGRTSSPIYDWLCDFDADATEMCRRGMARTVETGATVTWRRPVAGDTLRFTGVGNTAPVELVDQGDANVCEVAENGAVRALVLVPWPQGWMLLPLGTVTAHNVDRVAPPHWSAVAARDVVARSFTEALQNTS